MENEVHALRDGVVSELSVAAGEPVSHRPGDLRRRAGGGCRRSVGRSAPRSRVTNAESLAATASRVDHWILVEYRGLWGHDALAASGLSDQVKARLRAQARRPAEHEAPLRPAHVPARPQPACASSGAARRSAAARSSTPRSTGTTTCSAST